ncbi:hypothetical protein BDQ17DRAFT_1229017 [Cyathus striatus]|nr:hypothetical protein BDQ17DRAFT_1229017 [Cyathus striatus]
MDTLVSSSPIPQISISPAPPEEPSSEPFSPFSLAFPSGSCDDDFRPRHLTPPPTNTHFKRQASSLRPAGVAANGKGLEENRFQALLKASKERTPPTSRRPADLRREIAVKTHKNKQAERRALFLSKVLAPPSPTATTTPKTPPESPALFHYSLPSPGLVSPLALFESLHDSKENACDPWVEQVEFCRPEAKQVQVVREFKRHLPSLDQISAHLHSQGHPLCNRGSLESKGATSRPRLSCTAGRLQITPLPLEQRYDSYESCTTSKPSALVPDLRITTTVVPRMATVSPTKLSQANLLALECREQRAHTMLLTLRRRMNPSECRISLSSCQNEERGVKWKRRSAPADLLPLRERSGFEHPILALPGAF